MTSQKTLKKLDKFYDKVRSMVADNGIAVIGIGGDATAPPFSYTVGLSKTFGFELINQGVPPTTAQGVFNAIHDSLKNGESLDINVPDTRWANLPIVFKQVAPGVARHFAFITFRYFNYPEDIPFYQLVVPDRKGKFPWEADYDHKYMDDIQWPLYEQGDPRVAALITKRDIESVSFDFNR